MKKESIEEKPTKKEKAIDPLSLDDVPGLGPIGIKAINTEGYFTTLQVICKTPTWLKDVTGMDKDKAGKAFGYMKKKLEEADLIRKQMMTGTELLEIRQHVQRLKTGCDSFDNLLDGGFECRSITEIFGENGGGKTQLSHTLAIQAQRPINEGGLMEEGKPPPLVLYIDTETTCRPERMLEIATAKKLEQPAKYLDRIIIWKASNAYQQFLLVQNAIGAVKEMNIRLIIVDSGTALFRSDYLGRGNTKTKFDLMNEMVHDLKLLAEHNNLVVIFVNQIYHKPDEMYGADPDIPYGGNIIGHTMSYIIKLSKSGSKRRAKITKSPYQANDDIRFDIKAEGIVEAD